jgi:hypothetical protein
MYKCISDYRWPSPFSPFIPFIYIYINIDIYVHMLPFQRKTKALTIFLNRQFAYRAYGSLSFVCLLTKKQTEVVRLQTD